MAREIFAWLILAETDDCYMTFPRKFSDHKVSDAEIKQVIAAVVEDQNLTYSADEVYHLAFVAVSVTDEDAAIVEPLNPFVFWPTPIDGLNLDLKYRFRTFRATKGGEE